MKVESSAEMSVKSFTEVSKRFGSQTEETGRMAKTTHSKEETKKLNDEHLNDAIDKINKTVRIFNKSLHFVLHEETRRWIVQVIDNETKEVIREIPPKEVLDLVAKLDDMVGLLVDVKR